MTKSNTFDSCLTKTECGMKKVVLLTIQSRLIINAIHFKERNMSFELSRVSSDQCLSYHNLTKFEIKFKIKKSKFDKLVIKQ